MLRAACFKEQTGSLRCCFRAAAYFHAYRQGIVSLCTNLILMLHMQDCVQVDQQAVQRLQLLEQQAAAWQCVAHAESIATEQESQEGIAQATGNLSLQQKPSDQHKQQQFMLDHLDQWVSFVGPSGKDARFTPIPPALQQVAVRPFMLDNALNYLAAPSIDHRVAKQEQPKSAFAKLFTWNKK